MELVNAANNSDQGKMAEQAFLGPSDWVSAAMQALAAGGVAAVRVEPLARALGVSKGSFYWHFKDREALLDAVLAAWRTERTENVYRAAEAHSPDPRRRLLWLLRLSLLDADEAPGGPVEQAIRGWAVTSDRARATVEQVDQERLAVLARNYRALGLPDARAMAWAEAFYGFVIGRKAFRAQGGLDQAAEILIPPA